MPEPNKDIIRITREEATGSHVDDLIKRQMSLRGESGVTRDRGGRAWYYQSWFILLFIGGLAAFGAWAIVEPFFDDYNYFQGEIEKTSDNDSFLAELLGDQPVEPAVLREFGAPAGSITIRGEKIFLTIGTRELANGRAKRGLEVSEKLLPALSRQEKTFFNIILDGKNSSDAGLSADNVRTLLSRLGKKSRSILSK